MKRSAKRFIAKCMPIVFAFLLLVGPSSEVPAAEKPRATAGWSYNADYIYGMTRGVRDNRDSSAGVKMTIMPVTIVLDTVLLPVALIAGLFGQPE